MEKGINHIQMFSKVQMFEKLKNNYRFYRLQYFISLHNICHLYCPPCTNITEMHTHNCGFVRLYQFRFIKLSLINSATKRSNSKICIKSTTKQDFQNFPMYRFFSYMQLLHNTPEFLLSNFFIPLYKGIGECWKTLIQTHISSSYTPSLFIQISSNLLVSLQMWIPVLRNS